MSLSDKDLLTGSDQCEPRWKDDFEKSVGLAFFHMLCFCSYLSVPSCPYQSLFSLVNTNFLLVYWSKQNSLFTSRLTSLFRDEHSHIPIPQDSSIHTYIYSTQTTDHQTSTLCMRVCVCVRSGVLIMDGGARRCLRADLTLDPVTADRHQNNFGDSHTNTLMLCSEHIPSKTQQVWPFLTPQHKPTSVPGPRHALRLIHSFALFLSGFSRAFAKH